MRSAVGFYLFVLIVATYNFYFFLQVKAKLKEKDITDGQEIYSSYITPCNKKNKANNELTNTLLNFAPATQQEQVFEAPPWMKSFCPEVLQHFETFPYFTTYSELRIPYSTTPFAAKGACLLKIMFGLQVNRD